MNVVVLGASFDTPAENLAFAEAQHFGYALLSDEDRTVGAAYHATRGADEQFAEYPKRVSYLIDPDGVIRKGYEVSDVAGHAAEVEADVRAMQDRDRN